MDSKVVNKEIKKHIMPLLKDRGFEIFTSRCAWRYNEKTIDIVDFASFNSYRAEILDCTTFSFVIEIGVFIKSVPDRFVNLPDRPQIKIRSNKLCPELPDCYIRRLLRKSIEQNGNKHNDIWLVDQDGTNLDMVISDAAKVVNTAAFPWFDRFSNHEEILRTLINEDEDLINGAWGFGRNPCPIRNYLIGYIALAEGDYDLAEKSLKMAIDSDCFKTSQISSDYASVLARKSVIEE